MNLVRFASALVGALWLLPLSARAEPDAAAKTDAAKRFDRGVQLFDEGDTAGALAEFKQTYATLPNPVVLYNIGLVYAAMGRPVDAVDALSRVVGDASLSAAQRERAQSTLADQQSRIGRLSVTTLPVGARISVDGVDLATTPLSAPLRVAAGTHVVGAVAEGYLLARQEVLVAGQADAALELQLVRADAKRDANLMVRSRITHAEIFIDGKSAGKTPLRASLAVPAGRHSIELKRSGYATARQELELSEGATGEISLDLAVDKASLATDGVPLALELHGQKDAELFVDAEDLGAYRGPVRLPKGPHRVRVEAAGYMPFEQDVVLEEGKTNVLRGKLEPTPEARAAHDANVSFHRTWGFVGLGAGVILGGAGAAFLAINSGSKSDARDALNEANSAADSKTTGPFCDTKSGSNTPAECQAYVDEKQSEYDDAKRKDVIGFVGIGVGAAALVTGAVFLLTGEDTDKYASLPKGRRPSLALSAGPGSWGAVLRGSF
jgi:PEGA domain